MIRRLTLAMLMLLLGCGSRYAAAGPCTVSVPTMNFGTYTGALLTPGPTPLTVTCPLLAHYTVALNAGGGVGATTTTRKMTGPGSATLNYQMFQNSSLTTNWGNTSGTDTVSSTGNTSAQMFQIYPQAAAGQTVVPGTYTDTITVSENVPALGTVTTTFAVTALVLATCTVSASPLSFGTYSGLLVKSTSTITATCTSGTPYNVGLNAGTATGATVTTRSMTGPAGALLGYQLFTDAGYTTNWGNTVGTNTEAGTGTGLAQSLTVYGQIPAGQSPIPGAYSDTIIVTLTY